MHYNRMTKKSQPYLQLLITLWQFFVKNVQMIWWNCLDIFNNTLSAFFLCYVGSLENFFTPLTNTFNCDIILALDSWVWRRLVARYLGVVEAAGSSPVTQTIKKLLKYKNSAVFYICINRMQKSYN